MIAAVHQAIPLAAHDGTRVVVALFHAFKRLTAIGFQTRRVKARIAQHVHEQLQAFVKVAGQAIHAGATCGVAAIGGNLCGQKVNRLIKFSGFHGGCSTFANHATGHAGKTNHVLWLQVTASLEGHAQRDQRKLLAGRHVHGGSIFEREAKLGGVWCIECQRTIFNFLGSLGHACARGCVLSGGSCRWRALR